MKYNYEQVVNKILSTPLWGSETGVVVFGKMLEKLGNPQNGIPFVHVAGTNGKGSTTAFLCKILEQTGKKVGMFTSPHLVKFEERIRINGTYISREDVERLGNFLFQTEFEIPPTMFDYCLAMAVLYFKEQQCDIMVIETGIGGRFDSTNALGVPEVAVITKIGWDHMAILGDSIEKIAYEKAGIIKKGCSVVTCQQQPEVEAVIRDCYSDEKGIFIPTEEDCQFVERLPKKMVGKYQVENAAVAMIVAKIILQKEMLQLPTIEEYVRKGIGETLWKGRMEIVNENPLFMIDGAHNSNGVTALAKGLKALYPEEKFHFIMGVMADKDYEEMIEVLLPLAIDFITVTPEHSRALQSEDLAECIQKKGIPARFAENMETVIRPLLPKADVTDISLKENEKTIAFGSLYFIGQIEAMLTENDR